MCITEPFQAVSCFETKHLCSSHAWHLKTYLYNVSAPFVFFILIFSLYFYLAIQIATSEVASGFLLCFSRLRHWLPLSFLHFCGQRWNNPKPETVLPASCSLYTRLLWDAGMAGCMSCSSPEVLPAGSTQLQSLLLEGSHWGTDPSCISKLAPLVK